MIEEIVEWTTDPETRSCVGTFLPKANLEYIKKELQIAPIEEPTLKSRQKKAYSDKFLVIRTVLDLENEDLGIPYKLLEKTENPNKPGYKDYKFDLRSREEENVED